MKNQPANNDAAAPARAISLQLLLNDIVRNLPETINQNKVFVENEVSCDLKILADQCKVVSVINELLTTVLANARNTSILLTAEKTTGVVTLNIEDNNNFNGYALSFSLMLIGQHARFAGGDVSIRGAQQRVATVSFSFPDTPGIKRYVW
jgi:hypothetical protein